jgi:retron-type reverse transcriptase
LLPTLAPTVRDNGELNGVVFIDIRKAFDSINHNILLRKMKEQFGISNIE